MLGYGVAGALAPYLGATLRDVDPRLPFVLSSLVLLLTRWRCRRSSVALVHDAAAAAKPTAPAEPPASGRSIPFAPW